MFSATRPTAAKLSSRYVRTRGVWSSAMRISAKFPALTDKRGGSSRSAASGISTSKPARTAGAGARTSGRVGFGGFGRGADSAISGARTSIARGFGGGDAGWIGMTNRAFGGAAPGGLGSVVGFGRARRGATSSTTLRSGSGAIKTDLRSPRNSTFATGSATSRVTPAACRKRLAPNPAPRCCRASSAEPKRSRPVGCIVFLV